MNVNRAHASYPTGKITFLHGSRGLTGEWYTDHILEFVAEHKYDKCEEVRPRVFRLIVRT